MRKWLDAYARIALTLWVGGMWAIGYLVVPILFAKAGDRQLAGQLAGYVFEGAGRLGLVLGCSLILYWAWRCGRAALRRVDFWLPVVMTLLAALGFFLLQPEMAAMKVAVAPQDVMQSALKEKFLAWHAASSVLYMAQSLLGLWAVVRLRSLEAA